MPPQNQTTPSAQPNGQPQQNNPPATPVGGQNDYGSNSEYLQRVEHTTDMTDIRQRLDALEGRVLTRTALTASMADVYENDRNIDPVVCKHIEAHVDIKPTVEKTMNTVDRKWLIARLKSIWGFVVAVLLLAIGAGITKLLT